MFLFAHKEPSNLAGANFFLFNLEGADRKGKKGVTESVRSWIAGGRGEISDFRGRGCQLPIDV